MKKSKKGFTLAELLIVVAIIAVLTAIAVPLFVGALNNAETNVKEANKRAVRGAAVVKILEAKAPATSVTADPDDIYTNKNTSGLEGAAATPANWVLEGPWYAEATVTASGEVKGLTVKLTKPGDTAGGKDFTDAGYCEKASGSNDYTVRIIITKLEV